MGTPVSPGSWFQSGSTNAGSNLGKTQTAPGTESINTRITVGAASGALAAASTALSRSVVLLVPSSADTGVHIKIGAAATTSHVLLAPGRAVTLDTLQAINAIRGGATDVVVEVLALEVSA